MEKLGIGMLIRFARFLGCLVLFCECRSSADDAAVECVPRSGDVRAAERIKARKIISVFHSPKDRASKCNTIILVPFLLFVHFARGFPAIRLFTKLDYPFRIFFL